MHRAPEVGSMHYRWCLRRVSVEEEHILPEDKTELTIGRGKDSDLKCFSLYVSRSHCKILLNNGLKLLDLASANGTYINSQRILAEREIPLKDEDFIGIGTPEVTDDDCYVFKLIRVKIKDKEPQVECEASTSRADNQSLREATSIRDRKTERKTSETENCEDTVYEKASRKRVQEYSDNHVASKVPRLVAQSIRNPHSDQQSQLSVAVSQPDSNTSSVPQLDVPSNETSSYKQKTSSDFVFKSDILQKSSKEESANKRDEVSNTVDSYFLNVIDNQKENKLLANCAAEPAHRKELSDRLEKKSSFVPGKDNQNCYIHRDSVNGHANDSSAVIEHKVNTSTNEETNCAKAPKYIVISDDDGDNQILEEREDLKRVLHSENNPETNSLNKTISSTELDLKEECLNSELDNLENTGNAEQNLNKKLASFSSTVVTHEEPNDMQLLNTTSNQLSEDKICKGKALVLLERIDAVVSTTKIKQEENLTNYSMTEENIIELSDEDDEFPCSQTFDEAVVIKSEPMDDDDEEEKLEMKPFIRPDDGDDIICITDDSDESDNEWFTKLSQQDTGSVDIAQTAVASTSSTFPIENQEEEDENILNGEENFSCVQSNADDFERSDGLIDKQHDIEVKDKKTYGKPEIIEALPMPPRRAHQRGISANEAQRMYVEQIDQKCTKEKMRHTHKADADKKKTKAQSSRNSRNKHFTGEHSVELPRDKPPSKRKRRTKSSPAHMSGSEKKKIADKRKELLKAISQKQAVLEKNDTVNISLPSTSVKPSVDIRVKITEKNRGAFLTETVSTNTAVKKATGKRKISDAKTKCNFENKVAQIQNRPSTSSEQKASENKEIKSEPSIIGALSSEKQINQLPRIPRLSDKAVVSTKENVEDLVSKIELKNSTAGKAANEEPIELKTKCSEAGIAIRSSIKVSNTVAVKPKKSVCFKDEKELIQIFEIPKEQLRGLHPVGRVKDAPPPMRPYNQQQLISSLHVEEQIHRIASWNTIWLEEQKNCTPDNPPPVNEIPPIPMLSAFLSYSDYHRVVTPLLYLELWARISKGYEECLRRPYILVALDEAVHLQPFSQDKQLMMLRCHAAVTKKDSIMNYIPRCGDLVYFELGLESSNTTDDMQSCFSQGSGRSKFFSAIFAYVHKVNRESVNETTDFHKELLATFSTDAAYKVTFTLWTRSRDYHVKLGKPMRMKVINYIRSDLRHFQALNYLPSSPLCKHILDPTKQDFSLEEPKRKTFCSFIKEDFLNESQKQAILKITHACLKGEPKICMIQGPPGTGKSHVIVNLIIQLLYGQNNYLMQRRKNKNFMRILLCAPSNAAIDELVLRLLHVRQKIDKGERFKMVRIGNQVTMNPKVREISAQELARKDVRKNLEMHSDIESLQVEINHCKAKINSLEQAKVKNNSRIRELKMKLSQLQREAPAMTDDKMRRMEKSAELKIINGADIVATTLGSCFNGTMENLFYPDQNGTLAQCGFSCCIIDEATQSQELETLIPLMLRVTTLVLVGDAKQLPATVLSVKAKEFGLSKSLFARIQECFEDSRTNPVQFLDVQYRMHPEICLWPNRYFYGGRLHNANNLINQRSCPLVPYCILSLEYTQNSSGALANDGEARLIRELTLGILDKIKPLSRSFSVGIITPYNNQRTLLLRMLPPDLIEQGHENRSLKENTKHETVEVNTIDSFQGQERDIIIISVARTAGVGFLADCQRLNVALTRARCSLVLCGNFSSLKNDSTWKMLLQNAEQRKVLKHVPSEIENRDELMRLVLKQ